VNHCKKPGGDGDSSIRGHMKYATEQFVREFVSQEIKKSEQVTKTYIDKKINELDIKLSNQINDLQNQINEQNILLKKIIKHFNE